MGQPPGSRHGSFVRAASSPDLRLRVAAEDMFQPRLKNKTIPPLLSIESLQQLRTSNPVGSAVQAAVVAGGVQGCGVGRGGHITGSPQGSLHLALDQQQTKIKTTHTQNYSRVNLIIASRYKHHFLY